MMDVESSERDHSISPYVESPTRPGPIKQAEGIEDLGDGGSDLLVNATDGLEEDGNQSIRNENSDILGYKVDMSLDSSECSESPDEDSYQRDSFSHDEFGSSDEDCGRANTYDLAVTKFIQEHSGSGVKNTYDPNGPAVDYYIPWLSRQTKYDSRPYYRPIPINDDAYFMFDWDCGQPYPATEGQELESSDSSFDSRSELTIPKQSLNLSSGDSESQTSDQSDFKSRSSSPDVLMNLPIETLSNKPSHNVLWMQCIFCGRSFVEFMAFENHVRYVHGKDSIAVGKKVWKNKFFSHGINWKCELCRSNMRNADEYIGHLRAKTHSLNLQQEADWERQDYATGQKPVPRFADLLGANDHIFCSERWWNSCTLCLRLQREGSEAFTPSSVNFREWQEFQAHICDYHSDPENQSTTEELLLLVYISKLVDQVAHSIEYLYKGKTPAVESQCTPPIDDAVQLLQKNPQVTGNGGAAPATNLAGASVGPFQPSTSYHDPSQPLPQIPPKKPRIHFDSLGKQIVDYGHSAQFNTKASSGDQNVMTAQRSGFPVNQASFGNVSQLLNKQQPYWMDATNQDYSGQQVLDYGDHPYSNPSAGYTAEGWSHAAPQLGNVPMNLPSADQIRHILSTADSNSNQQKLCWVGAGSQQALASSESEQEAKKKQVRSAGMTVLLKQLYGQGGSKSSGGSTDTSNKSKLNVFRKMQSTIENILNPLNKEKKDKFDEGGVLKGTIIKLLEEAPFGDIFSPASELRQALLTKVVKQFLEWKTAKSKTDQLQTEYIAKEVDNGTPESEEENMFLRRVMGEIANDLMVQERAKQLVSTMDDDSSDSEVEDDAGKMDDRKKLLIAYGVILDALAPDTIKTGRDNDIATDIILQLSQYMFGILHGGGTINTIGLKEKYQLTSQFKAKYGTQHPMVVALDTAVCISLDVVQELCKLDVDSLRLLPNLLNRHPGLAVEALQDVKVLQGVISTNFT